MPKRWRPFHKPRLVCSGVYLLHFSGCSINQLSPFLTKIWNLWLENKTIVFWTSRRLLNSTSDGSELSRGNSTTKQGALLTLQPLRFPRFPLILYHMPFSPPCLKSYQLCDLGIIVIPATRGLRVLRFSASARAGCCLGLWGVRPVGWAVLAGTGSTAAPPHLSSLWSQAFAWQFFLSHLKMCRMFVLPT